MDTLKRALAGSRVAHAYLFHGPDGSGKRAAALAFAQALQCEHPESAPCDACSSCQRAARLQHPDIQVLMPQPADVRPEEIRERLDRLAEDPYATVDFVRRSSLDDSGSTSNRVVQYSVGRIHDDLHRVMSFKPVEGRWKVAVVTDAELLRKEAANAFLKLLEEPTPRTVFVLTTTRADRLLPTIVSRCQRIRFERIDDASLETALVERARIDPPVALTIARMADGSYARALDLAGSEELLASRMEVVDLLRAAYQVWSHADLAAETVERLSRRGREHQKFLLGLGLVWLRDLVLVRHLGDQAPIVNVDQRDELLKFSSRMTSARPEHMVVLVEEAMDLLDRNMNARLLFTVLLQRLHDAMHGAETAALVPSLVEG